MKPEDKKPKKTYTKIGNSVRIVELKETFSERIVPVAYLLRRRIQLETSIETARNELAEINEILRGVK
jgi:hypothetical protein